jgi:hydroxyethylthiazole kinase-like uncharacterized protein yjeF
MSMPLINPIQISQFAAVFDARDAAGHKGSFGSAAIVGGAPGMLGAAVLAARAALKTGAGRVYASLLASDQTFSLDIHQPELMWRPLPWLLSNAEQVTAWGIGCGLGTDKAAVQALKTVFSQRAGKPMVLDADALNALAYGEVSPTWGAGAVVLTPHPAEAARLLQTDTKTVQSDRPQAAQALALKFQAWVVLKGQHSIVCNPQGHWQTNPSGNVGLATAGSGDVLTGTLTSLLAQAFACETAVPAAVWLHGAAADLLVKQLGGTIGLTASELIDAIRHLRNHTNAH